MLVDIFKENSALGRDFIGDTENDNVLFVDTYERISKGVYYTNFLFKILGKELISQEFFFENIQRKFWAKLYEYEDDMDNPEVEALRKGYEEHMNNVRMPQSSYGVCDHPDQILEKFPDLETDPHHFLISVNKVLKSAQSPDGGWRWHKWGEYIGNKIPQNEYLYDEDETIEFVFTYEILVLQD